MPEHELCVDLHLKNESIELAAYSGSSLPYAFPVESLVSQFPHPSMADLSYYVQSLNEF